MSEPREKVDMGFTKALFPEGTHMCLIYDDDEHRKQVIGKFLAKGISLGEKAMYFADRTSRNDVETWLLELGVALPRHGGDGALEVHEAVDAYCPAGEFVPSEMIARLCSGYTQAIEAGYTGARATGEMTWSLRGISGSERLLEYEALINTISQSHPLTPICQYDSRCFDGATLLNVLKVHPMMIVREKIVVNPYYITPAEFFKERGMVVGGEG